MKLLYITVLIAAVNAHSAIVCDWQDFERGGEHWFAPGNPTQASGWVFTFPDLIDNVAAWKSIASLSTPDAARVERSINYPSGGGSGSPTYTASNETVARLQPGSGYIDFVFTNLPPSTLELRVIGCSTNQVTSATSHSGWSGASPPSYLSVRRPLVFKWEWQEVGVATNTHRVFGFYDTGNAWEMARLAFSALRYPGQSNVVTARLSLDESSQVSADVWMLWLYSHTDFSSQSVHKTQHTTFSLAEWQYRTNYAASTGDSPYSGWRSGTPSIPSSSSTSVSNAFYSTYPGLNTQSHESAPFATSSNWVGFPIESSYSTAMQKWYEPFGMTNTSYGQSLNAVAYNNGTAPPAWVFDGDNTNWLSGWGKYLYFHQSASSPINRHLAALFNIETGNGSGNVAPALRWHYFPEQENAARLAAVAIAGIAVVWPSISEETHVTEFFDNDSPYLGYPYSSQTQARKGKFAYDGWMGDNVDGVLQTVDYLWPYIITSQELADDLTALIPYISGQTNLVARHFERFLLDSLVREYDLTVSRGNPWTLGLVLQTGSDSQRFMDISQTGVDVTPNGGGGFKHQYASSYTQNGHHRIGSLFYAANDLMPQAFRTFTLYTDAGGTTVYNPSELALFPKIVAYAEWQAQLSTGAGYPPSRGDASRTISEARNRYNAVNYQLLWSILNEAGSSERFRMAKYLTDVEAQGSLTAEQWTDVQSQAAQSAVDIRYAQESRVLSGLAMLERGLATTNSASRGSAIVVTDVGYGHDHSDHLDLNIFMHGARLLSDFGVRNEGSLLMYPASYSPQVHNVVEVGGYDHPNDSQTEGHNSRNFLFSTGGVAQVVGAWAWSDGSPAYNHFSRLISLVDVDETNSYAVSVQRVDAGTWDLSYGAGTTAGGPTNLFTSSMVFTNLPTNGIVSDSTFRPAYKLRKHGWQGAYWPGSSIAAPGAAEWFKWRLSTATGSANITNFDGNGGTVAWADAAANMGASDDTYLKLHLFDRTNDLVCFADAFSSGYNFVSRRVYSMPDRTSISGQPNASQTYLELWEPFVGSAYVTNATSVAVAGTTTNYTGQKALRVQGAGWEDLHLSEAVGSNRVATLDTFSSDALYALYRSTNGAFRGLKLIGGYGATNGNYSLTLATNRIAATVSGVSHTNYSFTVSDWPTDGVTKTGWYRFWNADHETEYYITNFTGSTAKWKLDALIGTASVTTNYSSGNAITNDYQSLPVLAYPKRWTGLSFVNEAHTVHFRGNCTNSPTKITRTDGDVPTGSDFDDMDGDGWREARIYDFGNGDTVEVPAEATLELDGQGYTISANATVTVAIPGSSTTIYVDGVPIEATVANGVMKATILASVLTGKPQAIGLRKAQKPRRNGGHRLGGL